MEREICELSVISRDEIPKQRQIATRFISELLKKVPRENDKALQIRFASLDLCRRYYAILYYRKRMGKLKGYQISRREHNLFLWREDE